MRIKVRFVFRRRCPRKRAAATAPALGALFPLAIVQSEFFSPLAIVIMGRPLSSLLLSRSITPVLYSLMPPPGPEMEAR